MSVRARPSQLSRALLALGLSLEKIRRLLEDPAGEELQQSPHCHGFELLRSGKDPELFLLTILWDSADGHMGGFRTSPQFGRFFAQIKPYLGNLLEMEHYGVTKVSWRRNV